nr:phage portal protein [Kiloniella laminariae]
MAHIVGRNESYRGASAVTRELSDYNPVNLSPDATILYSRDSLVARTRDLARNNGFVRGAFQAGEDNVVGPRAPRLVATPDHRVLGITSEDADRIAREVEGFWRGYTEDPDFYVDASLRQNFHGLCQTVYWMGSQTGEILCLPRWLPGRGGDFSTAFELIEPDVLSNPNGRVDDEFLRGGVELGQYKEPLAYHFQKSHPGDLYNLSSPLQEWVRVPRATEWGRKRVIHSFKVIRPGMTRGEPGTASIIEAVKMLDTYERAEAQSNVINAIFAAVIESPYDRDLLDDNDDPIALLDQAAQRQAWHKKKEFTLDGVKIPQLLPGEKFNLLSNSRNNQSFAVFEAAVLRRISAGLGRSFEQVSRDYSKTNYSSARASLLEAWKFSRGELTFYSTYFYQQCYALWLEEVFDRGMLSIPAGAPTFYEAKSAWCSARFNGPGRGWIDPVKEAQAAGIRIASGLSTLEAECSEQGRDWEEVLEQLKREQARLKELGLPPLNLEGMLEVGMAIVPRSDLDQEDKEAEE